MGRRGEAYIKEAMETKVKDCLGRLSLNQKKHMGL